MQEELHNLVVPGSIPGHAATQASSMDRASENVSPPIVAAGLHVGVMEHKPAANAGGTT
jgi:hypothetical protein